MTDWEDLWGWFVEDLPGDFRFNDDFPFRNDLILTETWPWLELTRAIPAEIRFPGMLLRG